MTLLSSALPPRATSTTALVRAARDSLSLRAATVLLVAAGALGGALDVLHGSPVRTLFALFLALGAVGAASLVPRADVVAVVVAVPLVYLLLLVLGDIAAHDGGFFIWLATAFVLKAPVVLIATAVSAVVAVIRRTA